jgi:hypothetical protein
MLSATHPRAGVVDNLVKGLKHSIGVDKGWLRQDLTNLQQAWRT